MNTFALTSLHIALLLVGPIFFLGVINRTKALCAGRKGPSLTQAFFDLRRLLYKRPLYSQATSWVFQLAPTVVFTSTLLAGLISPLMPHFSLLPMPWDFVIFAYLLGLGRMFLVLSALDTASSFEGMGASREVTFASIVEPAFFIVIPTLAALMGKTSFADLLSLSHEAYTPIFVSLGVLTLFIILQMEAGRVPVDDPNTHLELTMVHEVMVLDHCGLDLAVMNYAAAMKMTLWLGLLASLLNPFSSLTQPWLAAGLSFLLMTLFAIIVGLMESGMARLRMAAVPYYGMAALAAAGMMLTLVLFQTLKG